MRDHTNAHEQLRVIEELYVRLSKRRHPDLGKWVDKMLELVRYLREHAIVDQTFVYTLHTSLLFTAAEDSENGVEIFPRGWGYLISYPMAPDDAPWPNAQVQGYTEDVAEAAWMLQRSFERVFR
jgi:hypothetical protein